jgi:hypothetical protein
MYHSVPSNKIAAFTLALLIFVGWSASQSKGQDEGPPGPPPSSAPDQRPAAPPSYAPEQPNAPPPSYAPQQLDNLVSRIALYPDPLLAQVLAGATFPDQIPDAARWADEHHYLRGDERARAISEDQLPWDPSVQALLPFPSILDTMASDMNWTSDLGNAFLAQRQDVMDAVQRMRQKARDYGYLRSNDRIRVTSGPYIEIEPADADYMVVPAYDPLIVFAPPRPGFYVGGAIGLGFGVGLGLAFRPWGWGYDRFDWGRHGVVINNEPWERGWGNRRVYAHTYGPGVRRWEPDRRAEGHRLMGRSEEERRAPREGRAHPQERHHEDHHH